MGTEGRPRDSGEGGCAHGQERPQGSQPCDTPVEVFLPRELRERSMGVVTQAGVGVEGCVSRILAKSGKRLRQGELERWRGAQAAGRASRRRCYRPGDCRSRSRRATGRELNGAGAVAPGRLRVGQRTRGVGL